jgi:hypothetical protein
VELQTLMNVLIILSLDVLRKLCLDGLPTQNYYELCAVYLLEYDKKINEKNIRTKALKELVEVDGRNNKILKNTNIHVTSNKSDKKKVNMDK